MHPVHVPIRCGECLSDLEPSALALAPSQYPPARSRQGTPHRQPRACSRFAVSARAWLLDRRGWGCRSCSRGGNAVGPSPGVHRRWRVAASACCTAAGRRGWGFCEVISDLDLTEPKSTRGRRLAGAAPRERGVGVLPAPAMSPAMSPATSPPPPQRPAASPDAVRPLRRVPKGRDAALDGASGDGRYWARTSGRDPGDRLAPLRGGRRERRSG